MPGLPPELKLLLDSLIAQVRQMQASNDSMHVFVQGELDKIRAETFTAQRVSEEDVEQKLKRMNEDMQKVLERLERMEKSIIDKQQQSLRRTVAVQATVLAILGSGIFGLIELVLHH